MTFGVLRGARVSLLLLALAVSALATAGCIRTVEVPGGQAPEAPAEAAEKPEESTAADLVAELKPDPAYKTARPKPYSWVEADTLIAHGMGGIDDKRVTNTLDAFQANYKKGHRVFEVDLIFSSDGRLIARHDWEGYLYEFLGQQIDNPYRQMDRAEFKSNLIHGEMTPLTIEDVVALMKAHPDVWIVTDTKSKASDDVVKAMRQIDAAIGSDEVLADRFIIQIYNERMLETVTQVRTFENIIYTLYQLEGTFEQAIEFSKRSDVRVVAMSDTMFSPVKAALVTDAGLVPAVYTVNDEQVAAQMRSAGVGPIYTDFLAP